MLENKLFEALLDVIPFGAYAVDVETYELVYANKIVRENMYSPQANYCWEKIYGNDEICQWCAIYKLQNRDYHVKDNEKISCEFFDEMDDRWLKSYDEIISWPDGRNVKYSILVNISDQKATQGAMIQSHAKLAVKTKHIHKTNKNLQITKLKLQKSLNEFEHLFNSTLEGIIILDTKGICTDVNDQAAIIFGVEDEKALLSKSIYDKIAPEDQDKLKIDEDMISSSSFEIDFIKDDGSRFPALIKITPLHSRKSILLSIVDLSELKQKDKIINDQLRMSSLEELLKNISHHWRQPLSAISAAATGMKLENEIGTLTNEQISNYCDNIDLSSQYLSKIIDKFSKLLDSNDDAVEFSLNQTIDLFLSVLDLAIEENKITIIKELKKEDVILRGSYNELIQCFSNILNNSIDAFKKNSTNNTNLVFITSSLNGENIEISIKDNAGGVDEKIINKVFEPYSTTKHKAKDVGLGLHYVYKTINKLNGYIDIKNVKYKHEKKTYEGSEIIITLPIVKSS